MANMPTSLPALETDIAGSDSTATRDHADIHNDVAAEVNAIGAKVGVDGSADTASLDYLVKAGANPGHTHTAYLGAAAAAGGDLSGNYPNPSVVDDSHGHSGATLTGVVKSGDAAGGDLGSTYPNPTIGANKVTDAMLRQSAALSLVGRSANSTGNVADIAAASDGQVMRRSGTSIGFGDISESAIADGSLLARVAGSETITGTWTFNAGTFLDKGSEVYNVKAYGAVGDGSTNDTSAIQAALDAAVAAGGGVVFLPKGTYKTSSALTVDADNIHVTGAGIGATIVAPSSATQGTFTFGNGTTQRLYNSLSHLSIVPSVTMTAGVAVTFTLVKRSQIHDLMLLSSFHGLLLTGGRDGAAGYDIWEACQDMAVARVSMFGVGASTGVGLQVDAGADITLDTVKIYGNTGGGAPAHGVLVKSGIGLKLRGCIIENSGRSIHLNPSTTQPGGDNQYVWYVELTDCYLDSGTHGLVIDPSGASNHVYGVTAMNCWFSGHDYYGVQLAGHASATLKGVSIIGGNVFYNDSMGITVGKGSDIVLSGIHVTHNAVTGVGYGINIGSGISHWQITSCVIGSTWSDPFGAQTQDWGIVLNGSNDYYVIANNDFYIGTVGYLFDTNTGTNRKVQNNLNVNPYGYGLNGYAQPAVPASTVGQANTFGVDCAVYVAGGTVTSIAVGGTATGITTGLVRVPAGATIAITYSVAPTWKWFGD